MRQHTELLLRYYIRSWGQGEEESLCARVATCASPRVVDYDGAHCK